jgi:hypothetical protein
VIIFVNYFWVISRIPNEDLRFLNHGSWSDLLPLMGYLTKVVKKLILNSKNKIK